MKLKALTDELDLCPLHLESDGDADVQGAYCGDLLSDVLANIEPNSIWFTIQGHVNIIAVAQLREVACICLVNGAAPDPKTVAKARSLGISLCGSEETSAALCMKLAGTL